MHDLAPKSFMGLPLTPREERVLRGIVFPEPPARHTNLFTRPLQGVKGIVIAALSLLAVGIGFMLLWPVASAKLSWLGDSRRLDALLTIMIFLVICFLEKRISLLVRLVAKLYSALEQERGGKPSGL
jgi:hypothetical protein